MNDVINTTSEDILIVDDTPDNLRLLSQILTEQGYRVRAVTSGSRALASVEVSLPDLILLDIRMPEMDGYEVCERLKTDAKAKDIPIIFISALNEIQDKVKAFTVGGVDYVTKPFQFEEVLARVETHLALRKLQKQLQIANEKMEQELALAGEVQASFLPGKIPQIPGWQLTVSLIPARETSGDFFDAIPLPGGRVGLLIADVVDKGVGAALFMALSSTLLRTYAMEYPTQPELVFSAVNERILQDTNAKQFVTVFYGILDPDTGALVYGNAGHGPPYLVSAHNVDNAQALERTGVPLGIFEDATWEQQVIQISPGDVLVLYTDGITEAQNLADAFYGRNRLLNSIQSRLEGTAEEIKEVILTDVYEFIANKTLLDDIALIIAIRE
jgi:serine phosphatase RsbU (regulator of sigma subunit)